MKLYVVRCYMVGCCGNEYHIVGVFATLEMAKEAQNIHNHYKHLHYFYVEIDTVILNEYQNSFNEGCLNFIKPKED